MGSGNSRVLTWFCKSSIDHVDFTTICKVLLPTGNPARGTASHSPHTGHFTICAGSPSETPSFKAFIALLSP